MKVSVVIPVHNRFTLADEALTSVINQTYRPLEIILVDDCSEKPFIPNAVVQSINEVTFKILRHETNQGPGASRETGRQAATGEYIAYLDSDDLWHPQKLEKQVAMLQANPEAGMCYCKSITFSELPILGNEPLRRRNDQEFHAFLPTILYGRPWHTSACLWKREASDKIGAWLDAWTWEDYEYDCRAGCANISIVYVPEVLCYARAAQDGDQLSQTSHAKQVIQKSRSLFAISNSLRKSNLSNNPEIRDQCGKILHFQAMHAFYLGEKELGVNLLKEKNRIVVGMQKIINSGLRISALVLNSNRLGDLCYKVRNLSSDILNDSEYFS